MSSRGRRIDTFWYMPATASRLAHVRLLVGGYSVVYLLITAKNFLAATTFGAERFTPVGPMTVLTAPPPAPLVHVAFAAAIATGCAFAAGFRYRVSGPLHALLVLALTSYRSSWGMLFHTENLLALHLVLLGVAPAADALSMDALRRARTRAGGARAHEEEVADGRYGWCLRAASCVTVATYVVAGIAKLKLGGLEWASGATLQAQVAFDNLRKIELGSVHSPLGAWLVPHRAIFGPLAALALALELGAPVALVGPRLARAWCGAAWLFHVGVLVVMAIGFPYPLAGVAFASFLRPETWRVLGPVRRVLSS